MKKSTVILLAVSLSVAFCSITAVFAYNLPDTAQTQSYTSTFGEDSDFSRNSPSYTKLDDLGNVLPPSATSWSMVHDNNTGLVWEVKTIDGSIHDKSNRYTWYNAASVFIANLNASNFGGYSDWRLPNPKELLSISDYGRINPAINTDYFPNENIANFEETWAQYWSSTPAAFSSDRAWADLTPGQSHDYNKSYPMYARAVRGDELGNNFVDNMNATITDLATGLMWENKTNDGGLADKDNMYTWESALEWIADLNATKYIGYDDWRLPNIKELQSIVDFTSSGPSIDTDFFDNTIPYIYWSSTTTSWDPSYAWAVWFDRGYVDMTWQYFEGKTDYAYVRAVRNVEPIPIPATILLFGSGLIGLAGFRRKFRKRLL